MERYGRKEELDILGPQSRCQCDIKKSRAARLDPRHTARYCLGRYYSSSASLIW